MSSRRLLPALPMLALLAPASALGVSGSDTITTIAGNGVAGFSGDGGQATSAELNLPDGVAVDAQGSLHVADYANHRVREVSGGIITTIAGTGTGSFTARLTVTDNSDASVSTTQTITVTAPPPPAKPQLRESRATFDRAFAGSISESYRGVTVRRSFSVEVA